MGDDTDFLALGLENRALFDVQFKERVHLARAHFFRASPTDPLQLVAETQTLGIPPPIGPILGMQPGKNPRGEHRRGKTRPFFIGEIHNNNRVFCSDIHVVQRADHLKPREHAKNPVILASRRLGVQMAAHINGQGVRVGAVALAEHVAHLVQPHGASRRLAPALEQGAPLPIGVGQGLAIVAACDAGADPGHLHQAVPQALPVDLEVFTWGRRGGGHGTILEAGQRHWNSLTKRSGSR